MLNEAKKWNLEIKNVQDLENYVHRMIDFSSIEI